MAIARFCRFALRTTQPAEAGEFYAATLGQRVEGITELPAAASARGAPPHWLGYIDARARGGAEQLALRFEARGAIRLGPARADGEAILRDPGGAIVALTNAGGGSRPAVVWHQLHTAAAPRAAANYAELFGWTLSERLELGALGSYQQFAWGAGEANAGSIADIEGRPELHPHWLFCFGVEALDAALARVRAAGGKVLGPTLLPDGALLAVCDDPQGAAFGLMQRVPDGAEPRDG